MMKSIFDYGNEYLKQSDWKDLAAIKFCLCSMGIVIGCSLPEKYRKPALAAGAGVFALTYVPLMKKLADIVLEDFKSEEDTGDRK